MTVKFKNENHFKCFYKTWRISVYSSRETQKNNCLKGSMLTLTTIFLALCNVFDWEIRPTQLLADLFNACEIEYRSATS